MYNQLCKSILKIMQHNHVTVFFSWLYSNKGGCTYTSGIGPLMNVQFILSAVRLLNKFLLQGYVKEHLKSSLRKCYGRYRDLIKQNEVPLSQMLHNVLEDDHIQ